MSHKDFTEGLRYKFECNSPIINENLKFTKKDEGGNHYVSEKSRQERKIYFLAYAECSVL